MHYNQSEIIEAVSQLTDDDITRLHKIALLELKTGKTIHNAQDLVQETIERVLQGGWKTLRHDIPFVKELAYVMKSIASSFYEKSVGEARLVKDKGAAIAKYYESEEYDYDIERKMALLLIYIENDGECATMMDLKLEDKTKTQICEQMKISNTQYGSIYRRMKRKMSTVNIEGHD
jgi:hypothetical protein